MTEPEYLTESERAIAIVLSKPMPVTGRAILTRIRTLGHLERAIPRERALSKKCRYCGVVFQGVTRRALLCSTQCRRAERNAQRRTPAANVAVCPECAAPLVDPHGNQTYCSPECRQTARVRRQRQAREVRRDCSTIYQNYRPERTPPAMPPTT